jgi:hypothetical protein
MRRTSPAAHFGAQEPLQDGRDRWETTQTQTLSRRNASTMEPESLNAFT